MEQFRKRVSSRRSGVGSEQNGSRRDASSGLSFENEAGMKEEPGFLVPIKQFRGNSINTRHNDVGSHYNKPSAEKWKSPDGKKLEEARFEDVQDSKQYREPQAETDSLLMGPLESGSDKTGTPIFARNSINSLIPHQAEDLDQHKRPLIPLQPHKSRFPGADALDDIPDLPVDELKESQMPHFPFQRRESRFPGADALDNIPDLPVDELKELEMQSLDHRKRGSSKDVKKLLTADLSHRIDDSRRDIKESEMQNLMQGEYASAEDLKRVGRVWKREAWIEKHRDAGSVARPFHPLVPREGDILVAVNAFTGLTSVELTLATGDEVEVITSDSYKKGWISGKLLSNGDRGFFPITHTEIKMSRSLAIIEGPSTAQTEPHASNPDTDNSSVPKIATWTGTNAPSGPVCGSCGAGWDLETGCSRSCGETQDGLGVNTAAQPGTESLSHNDENNDIEVVAIEEHEPPESVYAESDSGAESSVEQTSSNARYSAIFSEKSREQPTDHSSWLDSSLTGRSGPIGHLVNVTFGGTKEELGLDQDDEDCSRSVSSIADSIGSAASTGGSLGQAGVNYVVAKFTQSDPELLALYTEASQRLTKYRFVQNNRRLLKKFYLDFAHEDQTPSQREAVAFLKSRRRRAEISLDIFRTVTPDYDAIPSAEEQRREISMLNAYFETLGAADEAKPATLRLELLIGEDEDTDKNVENDPNSSDSDESDVGDGEDRLSLDMTSLQAIGEYFVTSPAFSQYKQRLRQFLHPAQAKEHESFVIQGAHHGREECLDDASRAVKPEVLPLGKNGLEHPVNDRIKGTGNQAEECLAEHGADDPRHNARSDDSQGPFPRSSQIQGCRMPWERDSFTTWVTKWVTDTLRPPSRGSQRIWYLCGLGQHTYTDVRELEPGGAELEWLSISESSAAAARAHSLQSHTSSEGRPPTAPSPVHLGPNYSRNAEFPNSPSQQASYAPQQHVDPVSATSPGRSGTTTRDPLFLLICINGKAYKTLAELRCLDIDDSYNDDLLVRGILDQYEQARKGCQWTIDLLLPTWMLPAGLAKHLKNIWNSVPISVRRPSFIRESLLAQAVSEWWNRWALDVSPWAPLHIIDTADFVEFELVPHPEGKEAFPSHFTTGCWPAPDNKQYRYRPVPMKCTKTMNLWHMRRPGPHTEVYWYNTVPKKVDGALYRPSGTVEDVVGYGVRINERLNDVLVLWWSFIFILATGLFIYVYSRCTADNSSAFGLGAYLVAAFTVYIQLQYAWWKRA